MQSIFNDPHTTAEKPICHINIAPDYRGGERQTELLIRELAQRGWRQRLVVRNGNPLAEYCQGIPLLEIVQVIGNPLFAAFAARGSRLVHAHEARSVYSGWLASVLLSIPFLLTRRVDNALRPSRLRDAAYARASKVVVISDAIAREVGRCYPGLRCDVLFSSHAELKQDAATVAEISARYEGKTLIGHVGALVHRQKGQRTIIDAAKSCARTHPDWHFLLLGDGEDENEFRQAVADLPNIDLVGFVENVADYLAAFDVFIFPSLHEGLGSVLLDAMDFGLPIVATNVGGIPEIVEDGVNGYLIEPEQPELLLATIDKLLADEASRATMSAANVSKAKSFGAQEMALGYEEIYQSILHHPEACR
jgi:glycosyltransferase involved in cell wall biosynthesis